MGHEFAELAITASVRAIQETMGRPDEYASCSEIIQSVPAGGQSRWLQ